MAKDWEAVAAAIRSRMAEIDMTQAELASRAGVALMTVRELQQNLTPRRRNPRTLAAVSEALGWPAELSNWARLTPSPCPGAGTRLHGFSATSRTARLTLTGHLY